MDNIDDNDILNISFGNVEIDDRSWRSMACHLNFGSSIKRAEINILKHYIASVLHAIPKNDFDNPLAYSIISLGKKQKISFSKMRFLMDYSDRTLIKLFTKSGVFSEDFVKMVFAKDQSKDIKLCYLLDSSGHEIYLLVRWLDNLDDELLRLQEFKKEIAWFNSHKKMEVASRVFNRKLGQPFVDKDFIEAYFFSEFPTIYEKRDLLKLIKSRYASFVHEEKKDKKQLNVYVDMKVYENFAEIQKNNGFSKSQLIQFLFDPRYKDKIQKLIGDIKSESFVLY